MSASTLSRREFLWVGAALGGGLLVQVACRGSAKAESPPSDAKTAPPNIFIRIAPDDTVHVTIPKSEMGQGVRTALALFVAEELDADWSKVRPEAAVYDPQLGSQGTGGSGSVLDTHSRLRVAGATMRQMLVAAATAAPRPRVGAHDEGLVRLSHRVEPQPRLRRAGGCGREGRRPDQR